LGQTECLQIFYLRPAQPGPSQLRFCVWSSPACSVSAQVPCLFLPGPRCLPSSGPAIFWSLSRSVWTDWGQSVFLSWEEVYCIVTALGRDSAISSSHTSYPAYMRGPSCLPLATCGPSGPPHTTYCLAGLLVRTQVHLDRSFRQDSMYGGTPSGI